MVALCRLAKRASGTPCPFTVRAPAGPVAADDFAANLPHLRLAVILGEMEHVVVAGDGITSEDLFNEPWTLWLFQSANADVSLPTYGGEPVGLPLPPPGQTFPSPPFANGLFQAIVHNGCVGSPATFDVSLHGGVYQPADVAAFPPVEDEELGSVDLYDEIQGWGSYVWKYTVRASDGAGNVSDFVIDGTGHAWCSGNGAI